MWLSFALLAGLSFTIQGLVSRHLLNGDKDSWAFSFFFSLIGALTVAPALLIEPKFQTSLQFWLLSFALGIIVVLHNFLNLKSLNHLPISLHGSLQKLRLFWVMVLGVLIFSESLSVLKILGTILTISAGLLVFNQVKGSKANVGVFYMLGATFIYAIAINISKELVLQSNPATATFIIFLIPAILNFILIPNVVKRTSQMALKHGAPVLIACFFGGLANLATNHALSTGEVTRVAVIIEAFLVVFLVGEYFFLKERSDLLRKALAVILATIGAILVRVA